MLAGADREQEGFMSNVYGTVEKFYDKHIEAEHILPMDVAERYLRRRAWAGISDDELKERWHLLEVALSYVMEMKLYALESLIPDDYQEILYRLAEDESATLTERYVTKALDDLEDFCKYLRRTGFAQLTQQLREARDSFYEEKHFLLPERHQRGEFYSVLEHPEEITPEDMDNLSDVLDRLLQTMEEYFHKEWFLVDLARAITLFTGPDCSPPQEGDREAYESFWFSFWDFFLFDYHMIRTDDIPLQYFYAHEKKKMDATEDDIVRDLLKARFTVFYIESMDGEYVTCRDLFTGKDIVLPAPDVFLPDYQRMVLYGHIRCGGVMLLNYISMVPASERLRQRIKDEILRQLELFRYQHPEATMEMFLARHAAAVRHTIHALTDYAQLKVVPVKDYPAPLRPKEGIREKYAAAEKRLGDAARKTGFAAYSIKWILRLYEDFLSVSSLSDGMKRRAVTLSAILLSFGEINGMDLIELEDQGVTDVLGVDTDDAYDMMQEIQRATGYVPFDPRYLDEEGFVQSVFTQ